MSETPVCPWDKKKIAPCYPAIFSFGTDNEPRKVELGVDETGVKIDRLEITKR